MAKQIIILEKQEAVPGRLSYRVAFWCAVPSALQPFYASANFVSAWTAGAGASTNNGPSQAEVDALRAGQVVEVVRQFDTDASLTLAQIKSQLQDYFTAVQAQVTARDPWDRYGSFYDGTSWTNGGV